MADPTLDQPLLAVMFADIAGSTKLYESAGDKAAHAAINAALDLMSTEVQRVSGRVIKTIGDEILATFSSAEACMGAACEIQYQLSLLPPLPGGSQLGVRIGMYAGRVIQRDGDVFGDTVNMAARLTDLAQKDQIITARDTVRMLPAPLQSMSRYLYAMPVKGKTESVELFEVMWQPSDNDLTMMTTTRNFARKAAQHALFITFGEKTLELTSVNPSVTIGRDLSADVPVPDRMASRAHGRIERRLDKFFLMDHSANGTYIQIEGDREIVLRREEIVLRGKGRIALGQSCQLAEYCILYAVKEV